MLAAQNVARASPDGHTVFITSNTTHAANQSLFKKLPYDPIADFEPVGEARRHHAGAGGASLGAGQQTRELIAYGKANPGKLAFGSGSSSARLAGDMPALSLCARTELMHCNKRSLLNHLVGNLLQMRRHVKAKCLGGLEIDHQIELTGAWKGSSLGLSPLRMRSA